MISLFIILKRGFSLLLLNKGTHFETFIKLFEKLCALSTHNNSSEENRGQSFYFFTLQTLKTWKNEFTIERIAHPHWKIFVIYMYLTFLTFPFKFANE